MKSWQLYDIVEDTVLAESNEYMELSEIRDNLLKNHNTAVKSLRCCYCEDPSKGDLRGKWIICNEKSSLFKKRMKK